MLGSEPAAACCCWCRVPGWVLGLIAGLLPLRQVGRMHAAWLMQQQLRRPQCLTSCRMQALTGVWLQDC
jgi:hypothetical protein